MSEDYFGPNNRYVKELTPSDFDSLASWKLKDKSTNCVFLLFYKPSCPWCQKIKADWEAAGKMSGFCDFAAFNSDKYQNHRMKMSEDMPELVRSFPTMIIYKNGDPIDAYTGERTAKDFVKFCMSKCGK